MSYQYNQLNELLQGFIGTGLHAFSNGEDIVSSAGLQQVNELLKEVGLPQIPSTLSPVKLSKELLNIGIKPLSFGENVLTANNISLNKLDRQGRQLGVRLGMIQRETATPADEMFFDITRELDWKNGGSTFRNGSSCWWSGNNGNNPWRDSVSMGTQYGNGFVVRLYYKNTDIPSKVAKNIGESNKGWYDGKYTDRGRCWVIPTEHGYVCFNSYDRGGEYGDHQYASLLSNLLKGATEKDWAVARVNMNAANSMYLNSSGAVHTHLAADDSKVKALSGIKLGMMIPAMAHPLRCTGCMKRFPASGWTFDSREDVNHPECIDCASKKSKGEPTVDTLKMYVQFDSRANLVLGQLYDIGYDDVGTCDVTGTRHHLNAMVDISGAPLLQRHQTVNGVFPKGSKCFVSVFNYYYMYDAKGKIVRRPHGGIKRKSIQSILPAYASSLKGLYGRTVGSIQRGASENAVALVNSSIGRSSGLNIIMTLSRNNQLWCNPDWAASLINRLYDDDDDDFDNDFDDDDDDF